MPSRVDLHTHTTASDGTLTPLALFDKAAELQIEVLAISDHDSTDGYHAVLKEASRHPSVRLIPAIEMGAEGELACHILGYFIDTSDPVLQARLIEFRERRIVRLTAMVEKLNGLGIALTMKEVLAASAEGSLGRPHIADALMTKGIVRNRQEAFDRFLKRDGPAFVSTDTPSAKEIIGVIRAAKGIPVLAHPSYYTSGDLLDKLVDAGLMGIEAYYPEHGRTLIKHFVDLCAARGLVATGGSDFHGPKTGRKVLGAVDVPMSVVEALEAARSKV